jgi:hypothetical protein
MMQTVQLSIADGQYAVTLREALSRTCAWHIEPVDLADLSQHCVMVLDEQAFARLPLPLSNPARVVLVTRKEPQAPQLLSEAWEAGIVSVVSEEDPLSTVLLAIMAAALRVAKTTTGSDFSAITPSSASESAPIAPLHRTSSSKRCKIQ